MADEAHQDDEKTQTHLVLGEGAVVSHYEIVGKIGAGGMGEVYLARDPSLDRTVALKFLPVQYLADDASKARFLREAKSAAQLNHPNVITIHEVSEYQGRLYIAMEHVEGQSLGDLVSQGELAWLDFCDIATQLAEGLSAAHKAGIVHRDLKPSNIMINKEGRAKILDFGLARGPRDERLTQSSTTMGTFPYMSPEQVRGEQVDHRSDLFSLGTVLFELATGSRPFPGSNIAEVGDNILRNPPRSPATYRSDVPVEFQHLLSKCFEKDPALRYQGAEEMLADLKRLRRELEGGHPDLDLPSGPKQRPRGAVADASGAHSSTIPTLPPVPSRRVMMTLAVASLLCLVSLYLWTPPQLQPFERVQLSPSQAERIARLFLTDQGISLYGYRFVTRGRVDQTLQRIIQKERIPSTGWADLAKWTSVFRYEVLAASADHQDRYYISLGPGGRMHQLRHVLRPDLRPDTLSASASASLAQKFARVLRIDTAGLEELPVNEDVKEGRLEREYRWLNPTPLAGGAVAHASVVLSGGTLVRAESSLQFPPTLQRSVEGESDDLGNAMFILAVAGLIVTLVVVVRQGTFVWPGVGLYLFFLVSTAISFLAILNPSFKYAEEGFKGIAGLLVSVLLILAPVLCLAATLLVALSHAALRTFRPQLMPGLSEALRARIPISVWIRSGALGLTLGAVCVVLEHYSTAACLDLAGIHSTPRYEGGMGTGLFELLGKHVFAVIVLSVLATFAALAVAVVLQRLLRLGRWMPPLLVLVATLFVGGEGSLRDLGPMGFLPGFLLVCILLWTCFRFGLLTGIILVLSVAVLSLANDCLAVEPSSFRILGGAFLLLWLVSAGISLNALFKRHPWAGESPATPPVPR